MIKNTIVLFIYENNNIRLDKKMFTNLRKLFGKMAYHIINYHKLHMPCVDKSMKIFSFL